MKFASTILIAFAALFAVSFGQDDLCTRMMKKCDLRVKGFQNTPARVWLGSSGRSLTGKLVTGNFNGVIIGQVNVGSKPADFIYEKSIVPVTKKGFTKYSFKPFPKRNGSGIGRQWFTAAQKKEARGKCVRVWFSHFQLFFPPTFDLVNFKRAPSGSSDCVVFRIRG